MSASTAPLDEKPVTMQLALSIRPPSALRSLPEVTTPPVPNGFGTDTEVSTLSLSRNPQMNGPLVARVGRGKASGFAALDEQAVNVVQPTTVKAATMTCLPRSVPSRQRRRRAVIGW